jgi:hypothetical protein
MPRTCEWIDGEPKADAARCGAASCDASASWCQEHYDRVFNKGVTQPFISDAWGRPGAKPSGESDDQRPALRALIERIGLGYTLEVLAGPSE